MSTMISPMRTIVDMDVLEDTALQRRMVMLSCWLFVGVVLVVVVCFVAGMAGEALGPWWFVVLVVVGMASFVVHELVHAAFFRLLGGRDCRISFGHQMGMLYTNAHGITLTCARMCCVLLAPTVLVDVALVAGGLMLGWPYLGLVCCAVHLSGCSGDILMAYEIVSHPEATHARDTDHGIELLA